jgi:hypothetical protein
LEAVIAVDDLTAVLAAALGKPVIKVAGVVDAWFWGVAGERIPWYPNLRVVRQGLGEAMSAVVARAIAKLDAELQTRPVHAASAA